MASGMERPTIKRKAGNTVAASPSRSCPSSACSSQAGTRSSRMRSLTNTISSMVIALKASIEASRRRKRVIKVICLNKFLPVKKPVDHPARISILVIEPGDDLNLTSHNGCQGTIYDTAMCIALYIEGDQRLFRIIENTFVFLLRRSAEKSVDLPGGSPGLQLHGKIRHRTI